MDSVLYLWKFHQFSNSSTRTTKKLRTLLHQKLKGK